MALVLLAVSLYGCAIVFEYLVINDGKGNNGDGLAALLERFPRVQDNKLQEFSSLVAILVAAVPLAVAPICFQAPDAQGQRKLTPFGAFMLYTLLATLLFAVVGYLSLDPEGWNRAQAHSLSLENLNLLQEGVKSAIRVCVFFLAALLGLKAIQ